MASEPDSSTFPSANTNASTCSTEVTLGSVTTNPSVRPPASTNVRTNSSSVRTPRRRVGASKLFTRIPWNGAASPAAIDAASARAAATVAASSSSSGRMP